MTSHQCHYPDPVSVAVTLHLHITVHHDSVTAVCRVTHVTRDADVLCYGEMLSRVRPPDNCCYIAVVLVVCCGLGQDECSHPRQPRTGMAIIYGLYLYKTLLLNWYQIVSCIRCETLHWDIHTTNASALHCTGHLIWNMWRTNKNLITSSGQGSEGNQCWTQTFAKFKVSQSQRI